MFVISSINTVEVEEQISVDIKELIEDLNHVVLYNDDVNTFDHVINCLIKYCSHTSEQAEQCAFIVHYKGKCSVKKGNKSSLLPIHQALLENGLSSSIQ